jgi:hypothetical protein
MMMRKLERSEMVKRKPGRKSAKELAARTLGSLGGSANTDKQNAARKQNAQRAGRPRRVCITCNEPVVGGHVDRRLDTSCGAHGWRWQRRDDPHVSTVDENAIEAVVVAQFGRLSATRRAVLLQQLAHRER